MHKVRTAGRADHGYPSARKVSRFGCRRAETVLDQRSPLGSSHASSGAPSGAESESAYVGRLAEYNTLRGNTRDVIPRALTYDPPGTRAGREGSPCLRFAAAYPAIPAPALTARAKRVRYLTKGDTREQLRLLIRMARKLGCFPGATLLDSALWGGPLRLTCRNGIEAKRVQGDGPGSSPRLADSCFSAASPARCRRPPRGSPGAG